MDRWGKITAICLCHRRTKTDRLHTNSATTIKEHLVFRPVSMKFFYFIVFIIKHKYGKVSKFKKMMLGTKEPTKNDGSGILNLILNIKFSTFNWLKTTFSITFTCLSVFSPYSIIGDYRFKPNFAMRLGCVSSVNLNNKSLSPITSVTLLDASNKTAEVCILGGKNQNLSSDLEFRCVFKDYALTRLWSYFIYFPTVFIFFV